MADAVIKGKELVEKNKWNWLRAGWIEENTNGERWAICPLNAAVMAKTGQSVTSYGGVQINYIKKIIEIFHLPDTYTSYKKLDSAMDQWDNSQMTIDQFIELLEKM